MLLSAELKKAVYIAQPKVQKGIDRRLQSEEKNGTVHRMVKQMIGNNKDVVGAGFIKAFDGKIHTCEI